MKDLAHFDFHLANDQPPALGCKIAHANQPVRFENLQRAPQMLVADRKKSCSLGCRQFVGCEIGAGRRQEGKRAIVGNVMFREEGFGRSNRSANKPHSLRPLTSDRGQSKPCTGRFGCSLVGFPYDRANVHPIAHGSDFSKGHARLRHAEWPGIHAEKDARAFVPAQIVADIPRALTARNPADCKRA